MKSKILRGLVMKKIGILTYFGVPNYGAWTQAYALNHVIKNMISGICKDIDVEHINYLDDFHWEYYYKKDLRLYNSFSYSWNQIPHTKQYSKTDLNTINYDMIITGSDSIWTLPKEPLKPDYTLIGEGLNTGKICAYAVSAGNADPVELSSRREVIKGLKKYNTISVRDSNTKELVKKVLGDDFDVAEVLDPALLWDFSRDEFISIPKYDDYIVVYGIQWNDKFINEAVDFARRKNLKLISAGFINNWCDVNIKMVELRANEWIGFFSKAKYVITSTFHGLMVGINYKKQIKFCPVEFVGKRSETLIEKLGIQNSLDFESSIDYDLVLPILKELQISSLDVIKHIIVDE